jgi:hypothetical protein
MLQLKPLEAKPNALLLTVDSKWEPQTVNIGSCQLIATSETSFRQMVKKLQCDPRPEMAVHPRIKH